MTEKISLIKRIIFGQDWALVVTNQGELALSKNGSLEGPLTWDQAEIGESKIFMLWVLSIVPQQFPLMWEQIQELKEDLDHLYQVRAKNDSLDEAENV